MNLSPFSRWLPRFTTAVIMTVIVAACGVPVDPAVRRIDSVPWQLMATTTSTTTTSSTTTSTIPIASTQPTTSLATTTTIADNTTELIPLYFVSGERFVEERRVMPVDTSLFEVINSLVDGPRDGSFSSFRITVVNVGDVLGIQAKEGLATVELSPRFNDLASAEQRRLVGQLVLTLGSQRGVGQVRFTVDGNSLDVPQGDGTFGTDALSRDSFLSLVDEPPVVGDATADPSSTLATSTPR